MERGEKGKTTVRRSLEGRKEGSLRGERREERGMRACLTKLTDFARLHQTRWSLHSINIARECVCVCLYECVVPVSINIKKSNTFTTRISRLLPNEKLSCLLFCFSRFTCFHAAVCQLGILPQYLLITSNGKETLFVQFKLFKKKFTYQSSNIQG